jgi:1-deoxy-D-xylulose-5-phosphate synthase
VQLGRSEIIRWGTDGALFVCGGLLEQAIAAADQLATEGIQVAVVNARFVKPLDEVIIERLWNECRWVLTIEEAQLMAGFGSAVVEAASTMGLDTRRMRRLGIPDRFIEHGEREELLADLQLDERGIAKACRELDSAVAEVVNY